MPTFTITDTKIYDPDLTLSIQDNVKPLKKLESSNRRNNDRWKSFFDQSVKHDLRTYDNIRKFATDQGYNYITGCLQGCRDFKKYYTLIAIDLSKQQKIDADPKGIQQINITENLEEDNATKFFIIEEAKETVSQFSKVS